LVVGVGDARLPTHLRLKGGRVTLIGAIEFLRHVLGGKEAN